MDTLKPFRSLVDGSIFPWLQRGRASRCQLALVTPSWWKTTKKAPPALPPGCGYDCKCSNCASALPL